MELRLQSGSYFWETGHYIASLLWAITRGNGGIQGGPSIYNSMDAVPVHT